MNKTIKIIDLLNKIANGENIPKQIEYRANLYRLDENKIYRDVVDGSYFVDNLNDEVEIIEEQQDIDIQELKELNINEDEVTKGNIIDTINDIIIYLKQKESK